MSNHAIGYEMQNVGRFVLDLFDSKRISTDVAQELILKLNDVVSSEDGNYWEFAEFLSGRCGCCLAKTLYPEYDLVHGRNSPFIGEQIRYKKSPFVEDLFHFKEIVVPAVCHSCYGKLKYKHGLSAEE